jgi:hypothetical protein
VPLPPPATNPALLMTIRTEPVAARDAVAAHATVAIAIKAAKPNFTERQDPDTLASWPKLRPGGRRSICLSRRRPQAIGPRSNPGASTFSKSRSENADAPTSFDAIWQRFARWDRGPISATIGAALVSFESSVISIPRMSLSRRPPLSPILPNPKGRVGHAYVH